MRKEVQGVTEALLRSAEQEFISYGFHGASLRRISADSGVSTNSIYTRFGDKEGLFEALVKPAADELMDIYVSRISEAAGCMDQGKAVESGTRGTNEVIDCIYRHFTAFKLIFCHSAGTAYEDYFDRLGAIEESYYREFVKRYAAPGVQVSDFFVHVICRTGWQYVYEVVSHKLSYEEAVDFMGNIQEYCMAGWQRVLGGENLLEKSEEDADLLKAK